MKKALSLLVTAALLLTVTACSSFEAGRGNNDDQGEDEGNSRHIEITDTVDTTEDDTTEETPQTTEEPDTSDETDEPTTEPFTKGPYAFEGLCKADCWICSRAEEFFPTEESYFAGAIGEMVYTVETVEELIQTAEYCEKVVSMKVFDVKKHWEDEWVQIFEGPILHRMSVECEHYEYGEIAGFEMLIIKEPLFDDETPFEPAFNSATNIAPANAIGIMPLSQGNSYGFVYPLNDKNMLTTRKGCIFNCTQSHHDSPPHKGQDFNTSTGSNIQGMDIFSVRDGVVEWRKDTAEPTGRGYAIAIRHTNNLVTVYQHMQSPSSSTFARGNPVNQGDVIGKVGDTGTGGFHLHFEVITGGQTFIGNSTNAVDPWPYLANTGPFTPNPTYTITLDRNNGTDKNTQRKFDIKN